MSDDAATCRWLVSGEGRDWLARAAESPGSLVQRAARLRRDLSAERCAAVLRQLELRDRARAKFMAADRLFFLPTALQQATDQLVAEYKARRFARFARVADLCCGIGGDLMALAAQGQVNGIDRNPSAALLAEANLAALGRTGKVIADDVAPRLLDADAWHIDPDRRATGRRTTQWELCEPGPALWAELLRSRGNGAIKLAPATAVSYDWSVHGEREWISRGGECKQQMLWCGGLAESPGQVRATVLARALETPLDQAVLASIRGTPDLPIETATGIGRYVFDVDAAVLAAGLSGQAAAQHALKAITPGVAYLTADQPIRDGALACFQVLEVMPYRAERLAAWLLERNIGQLEIKARGVKEDAESIRRRLRSDGDEAATIILLPVRQRVTAIVARRMPP